MVQIKIEDYQYEEFNNKVLFINKYDVNEFKYLYELNVYWKEFAFDLINELYMKDYLQDLYYGYNIDLSNKNALLIFIKNNYKMLIEKYKLNIDFRDYIELNNYVTLKEWLENDNHFIDYSDDGIFLFEK